MRHGHAVPEAPQDSLRELSASGQLEVQNAVKSNLESFSGLQLVVNSPYIRAQQTADIAVQLIGDITRQESSLLTPNGSVQKVIDYLHTLFHDQALQSVMIVGHQPLFGSLVDDLCGLEPGAHRLATASIAAIDTDVIALNCCQLRWLHHVI